MNLSNQTTATQVALNLNTTNSISEIFNINLEDNDLKVCFSLITPEDQSSFCEETDGLTDTDRHSYLKKKTLFLKVTIIEHNNAPCIIDVNKGLAVKNRMKSLDEEDLKLMLSMYGASTLNKGHIKRKIINAIGNDFSEYDEYFDNLDSIKY